MKVTRRGALKSAGVLGVAAAIGCDDGNGMPGMDAGADDAATPERDAQGPPTRDAGPAPTGPFRHGVASGDPLEDAVILWTRVTIDGMASISVDWEMSADPAFVALDASGTVSTDASRDFTVKVDATGLAASTTYYYRFRVSGTTDESPIGRTRTAPAAMADVARLRFAVVSCSSYAHGWFHGYANIAQRADLDAVLHLGDYVYEYGDNQYGNLRPYDPPHECTTLEDYRRRYAHYRSDPDVQAVHRQHPFVCIWDDHETANNSWRDGAQNHMADEGDWAARKAAGQQAYSEWIPIRTPDPARIWRSLRYGRLAELVMLDTRLEGRDEQGVGDEATRDIIGAEQEAFLIDTLAGSDAQWKIVGQQVIFSPIAGFPNDDQWEGYPAQRARIIEALRTGGRAGAPIADVVVLTGDIHTAWAIDIVDDPALPPVGVELVTSGMTSPSIATPGPLERGLRRQIEESAPHVRFVDLINRGYYLLDVTPEAAQADFVIIADVTAPYDLTETASESWRTVAGTSRLEMASGPVAPVADPPPLAP